MPVSARFSIPVCLLLLACTGGRNGVVGEIDPAAASVRSDRRPTTGRTTEVRTWYLRAAVAERRGDVEEADKALDWVRRFEDPASPWPYVAKAGLYERVNRHDDAISAYQTALERDEACAQAHLGLGRTLVRRRLDAAAQPHLERAAELEPGAEVHELLGRLYVRSEEQQLALAVLDKWMLDSTARADALRQMRLARHIGCDATMRIERLVASWKNSPQLLREGAAAYDGCGMSDGANILRKRADSLEGES